MNQNQTKTSAATTKKDGRDARLQKYLAKRQKEYELELKEINELANPNLIKNEALKVHILGIGKNERDRRIVKCTERNAKRYGVIDPDRRDIVNAVWNAAWLEGQKYGKAKAEQELLATGKTRLPLRDAELRKIWDANATSGKAFARAVEAAHGITYKRITNEEPSEETEQQERPTSLRPDMGEMESTV